MKARDQGNITRGRFVATATELRNLPSMVENESKEFATGAIGKEGIKKRAGPLVITNLTENKTKRT